MDLEERIKYYMGDLYSITKVKVDKKNYINYESLSEFKDSYNKRMLLNKDELKILSSKYPHYLSGLFKYVNKNGKNKFVTIYIGDNSLTKKSYKEIEFCFIKNRVMGFNRSCIIFKSFNQSCHWNPNSFNTVTKNDIPFNQKKDIVFWRGSATGIHRPENIPNRYKLVTGYFNKSKNIDVGYSNLIMYKNRIDSKYLKNSVSIAEMLKYKFLISVEGNDVATGLKWQLLSNSVVFMPKPSCTSWLMEDLLIPDFHYVLLKDDFSDLEEKTNWAINNPSKCIEISENASKYMKQFFNNANEQYIESELVKRYNDKIEFI